MISLVILSAILRAISQLIFGVIFRFFGRFRDDIIGVIYETFFEKNWVRFLGLFLDAFCMFEAVLLT